MLRLDTVALVLNTDDEQLVRALREQLAEELGARFELVWTRIDGRCDRLPRRLPARHERAPCTRLLGRVQVRQAALPEAFQRLSLRAAVEAMQRRLAELPEPSPAVEREREALLRPHGARLGVLQRGDRRTSSSGLTRSSALGATQRAFVAECWVPRAAARAAATRDRLTARRRRSRRGSGDVAARPAGAAADAQFARWHGRSSRSSRFLELPRAGSFDPTLLTGALPPADVRRDGRRRRLRRRCCSRSALLARRSLAARAPALAGLTWIAAGGRGVGDRLRRPVRRALRRPRQRAVRRLGAVALPARRRRAGAAAAVRRRDRRGPRRARARAGRLAGRALPRASPSCSTSSAACSSSAVSSASPAWAADHLPGRRADPVRRGDGRRARPRHVAARGARPDHRPARVPGHARERPLLPAARRRRPGVGASRGRRERAGDRRADLDGRARRRLLPRPQPRAGRRSAR